ncbi:hypothetical protein FRB91_006240 [Serendipita sp. 411]|nr:hypothetical protein FRC15_007880 [Serendipita sp. 397]KAG8766726.1 hypothetical protein FRC16_007589 [Serendipita sp. 398]KAG8861532.1 hypothetical protein FRB91_006240 [Serendipita sp. 411]
MSSIHIGCGPPHLHSHSRENLKLKTDMFQERVRVRVTPFQHPICSTMVSSRVVSRCVGWDGTDHQSEGYGMPSGVKTKRESGGKGVYRALYFEFTVRDGEEAKKEERRGKSGCSAAEECTYENKAGNAMIDWLCLALSLANIRKETNRAAHGGSGRFSHLHNLC